MNFTHFSLCWEERYNAKAGNFLFFVGIFSEFLMHFCNAHFKHTIEKVFMTYFRYMRRLSHVQVTFQ